MQPATLLLAAAALFASSHVPIAAADDITYAITQPATGDVVSTSEPSVIKWTSTSTAKKVSFFLEAAGSSKNLFTIATNLFDSGSIAWQPPSNITPATDYVIVLQPEGSTSQFLSAQFTITDSTVSNNSTFSPTAGQKIHAGVTIVVLWPVDSSVTNVSVFLMQGASTASLTSIDTVATDITNHGNVAYVIPDATASGDDYVFAIQDLANSTNTVYTPQFTIVGSNSSTTTGTATATTTGTATGSAASSTGTGASTTSSSSASASGTSKSAAAGRETAQGMLVGVLAAALACIVVR